jgi:hypothetical protein
LNHQAIAAAQIKYPARLTAPDQVPVERLGDLDQPASLRHVTIRLISVFLSKAAI